MKRIVWMAALCGLLPTLGHAADHELSVEFGTFGNNDETYRLFSQSDAMTSWGVRGGYAVHDRVSLIASYHHHQRGAMASISDHWDDTFQTAYFAELIGVGAKADIQPLKWLQFYSAVQGLVYIGTARFDAEPNSRTNIGQFTATSAAIGGQWTAGTELKFGLKKSTIGLAWHIEGGYGIASKHQYRFQDVNADVDGFDAEAATTNTMQPNGFVLRSGLGIRF